MFLQLCFFSSLFFDVRERDIRIECWHLSFSIYDLMFAYEVELWADVRCSRLWMLDERWATKSCWCWNRKLWCWNQKLSVLEPKVVVLEPKVVGAGTKRGGAGTKRCRCWNQNLWCWNQKLWCWNQKLSVLEPKVVGAGTSMNKEYWKCTFT